MISSAGFSAQRDTSKVEWIKTYFNAVSDHSVATPNNKSRDNWDIIQPLVDRIDSANYSIDLMGYEIKNMRVGHALANATRRGVRVRVVTDNSTRNRSPKYNQPMWDTLRAAGIYNIDDAGTVYQPDGSIVELSQNLPNAGAIMHNKYAVFDVLSENPEDDFVWTGSMNITYTGPWNTNVTFVIKDNGIAKAYSEEFQQMWGSKTEIPNPNKARFHKDKYKVSQNIHYVNNIKVEVYFSPMNRNHTQPSISKRITELINHYAKNDVEFLSFAISPDIPISQAMINRSGRGEIRLQGVIDPAFYAQYRNKGQIWAQPEMSFGNRLVLPAKEVRKLHAKTIIIDALYPYPEKHKAIVIAGSYNFSKAAEKSNDENILMIHDNKIANQFYQDFMGVQGRALKKSYHRHPSIDTNKWYSNFRFNQNKEIEIELSEGFYYPVQLLGVNIPRLWAGSKDSSYFYAKEAHQYLQQLLKGTSLKVVAGKEVPEHKFGSFFGYIKAKTDRDTIDVNRRMLSTGNASYSFYNRQQRDSILAFKSIEKQAKENKRGMWAFPEAVNTKILNEKARKLKDLFPLDINEATPKDLTYISGIGPKTAQKIIEFRNEQGGITNLDDLLKIWGIGPATLKKLKEHLIIKEK